MVIVAQSEQDPENHQRLAEVAQQAVKSHPRATLHHCPDRIEDDERVGNDISDMFVRGELPSWSALCETVEPPINDGNAPIFSPDEDGLEEALSHCHIGLRYNDRGYAIEYRFADEDRWQPLDDRKEAKIRRNLARECLMPARKDDVTPFRIGSDPNGATSPTLCWPTGKSIPSSTTSWIA